MRTTICAAALLTLVGSGCGDTTTTGGADDLTASGPDLRPPADLSVPVDLEPPADLEPPVDLVSTDDLAVAKPKTWQVAVGPMNSLTFAPAALNIKVGDSVKWTWAGGGHTVTSGMNGVADNKFCSPADMNCAKGATSNAAATYTHTFKAVGAFPYFCLPHANAGMTGSITVK